MHSGRLGDGTTNQQNDASIVAASISGAISIDVGRSTHLHSEFQSFSSLLGRKQEGQVGDGSTSGQITSPTEIH